MSNYLVKWEEQAEAGDIECVMWKVKRSSEEGGRSQELTELLSWTLDIGCYSIGQHFCCAI